MRNIWDGTIKLSGIEIGIKLAPASIEKEPDTCLACPDHIAGVEMFYRCKNGGEFLRPGEVVRAVRYGEQAIPFTKEELSALNVDASKTIEIKETRSIYGFDPAMLDKPYAVQVNPLHEDAYAAVCRALDRRRLIGIGNWVYQGRIKTVALLPNGSYKALTLFTLRKDISPSIPVETPALRRNVKAVTVVLEALEAPRTTPIKFEDSYQDDLAEMIQAKVNDKLQEVLA